MDAKLQEAFKNLTARKVQTFPAKVVSVDKDKGTCTVSANDLEFTDVALSATVEDISKRFHIFPKVESFVLISPINEDIHRLYVEFFSEVESVDIELENVQFQMDAEGFLLRKENETLKKLMSDLIKACKNLKFQTNTGVTIALLNLADFTAVETRFNQFLK